MRKFDYRYNGMGNIYVGNQNTIAVSDWKSGLYILRIHNEKFSKTMKVVKK
jgi:hypothetical protein